MYRRNIISRSLIQNQYNLNHYILESCKTIVKRNYTGTGSFLIRNLKLFKDQNNLQLLKDQIKLKCDDVQILKALHTSIKKVPHALKEQSESLIRIWTRQCECVIAQRVRRGQQMFTLYSKLWEKHALHEIFKRVRQQMLQHGKKMLIGATGISVFNWNENKISDDDILQYSHEIENIHVLSMKTVVCPNCELRKKVDRKIPNIIYCQCPDNVDYVKEVNIEWRPFLERQDILVWKKEEQPGKFSYKFYGSYNDVTAEDFLQVQINTQYRKIWDESALHLEVIESNDSINSDVIYWEMKWPRFFSNRDYVFKRRFFVDKEHKTIVIVSRAISHPCCPLKNGNIRVNEYWSYMVIRPYSDFNEPGIEFGLTYFDDPGIKLPETVTNLAVNGVPDFLMKMRNATKKYKQYLIGNNSEKQQEEELNENESEEQFINSDNNCNEADTENNNKEEEVEVKSDPVVTIKHEKEAISAGNEVLTSPSCLTAAEDSSYWRYLHPYHYFS